MIAELTTDKATFELEAPAAGRLIRCYAETKSIVPIGYIIALIGQADGVDPAVEEENAAIMALYRQGSTVATASRTSAVQGREDKTVQTKPADERSDDASSALRATPRARRLAEEKKIDLAAVQAATGANLITEVILRKFIREEE